jgi:hypothetical protein
MARISGYFNSKINLLYLLKIRFFEKKSFHTVGIYRL